jgi:L-lactate dehydrogenase complex protein LldF
MTTSPFHAKIRQKIADEALQIALDANAERRVHGRIQAFASLPDWQDRRQRAHAIRAQVITHLDEYLGTFTTKLTENGIIVHRAKDAAQAIRIALEIFAQSPQKTSTHPRSPASRLVAKSKSMVTEEIGLNHALEAAGHRVVETDLGEYIVQLRGERPSHIITPAVHMRRHEVGELFHEKLGIPYTEDIPTLTNTARKVLREVFLTADVGVSGVNFGVAGTGTLAIVTNEGNGRMVTTLPRVHIAFMGLERLVRSLDDLALMLSLLPRSATGQKISVYTQLLQRPLDGQQRHLILVDNGRLHLRNSSLQEILYCIRCGACMNACPVFRELGGHAYLGADGEIAPYPGPLGAVVSPGLLGQNFVHLAQASSLCGACKDACPVDIDLPKLLTRVRAGAVRDRFSISASQAAEGLPVPVKLGLQMYTRLATRPGLFALSQRLAGLGARLVSPFSMWLKFPAFTGWGYSKDFPRPAAKPFRDKWRESNHRDTPAQTALPGQAESTERFIKSKEKLIEQENAPIHKDLVAQFTEELTMLGGHVVPCKEADLPGIIITLLREKGIDQVQAWDQVPGLEEAHFTAAGISVRHEADERIKAGITGALAGVAETGTLVIQSGPGQPLSASLLPEIHIAVLHVSDIQENLAQVLHHHRAEEHPAIVLVSGPSRTADIEMTLTIGVHGPGELRVFLLA